MKKNLTALFAACAALMCMIGFSEEADERVYTMVDENGQKITSRLGKMHVGDEYISRDNMLYAIDSVDDESATATARLMGPEEGDWLSAINAFGEENNLILMYSTHSDESYIPGDGESSLEKNAGIYDVGEAFSEHLQKLGFEVEYSKDTFLPHDAGAYRRSRAVAEDYAKRMPKAMIDIHRDGIPKDEYETTVEGEDISMVRLFVGKSNANASENRAFAKKIKAIADDKYPGLVKDIYIGKGNYNQDLYPQAILLEFGTHEIEKDKVIDSTEYMAKVLSNAVGGGEKAKEETKEEKKAPSKSIFVLIGLAAAGVIAFALVSTGSFKGAGKKIRDTAGEITGGLFGGRHRK